MEAFSLPAWLWLLAGLAFMGIEILTPGGFFSFFLGIAALAVGFLSLAAGTIPFTIQGILFVVLSGASIVFLRKPLLARFPVREAGHAVDSLAGEFALVKESIPAGGEGQVELRGSIWKALNLGADALGKGAKCRVERIEGLTLYVR